MEKALTKKTWNDIIGVQQNLESEKVMDKNKILEAAQKNGDRGYEYEYNVSDRASLLTLVTVLVVVMLLSVVEYFAKGYVNLGFLIVGATAIATDTLYNGIAFKKAWKIVVGSLLVLMTIILIIAWVVMI